jgi:uncharacterized protein YegL
MVRIIRKFSHQGAMSRIALIMGFTGGAGGILAAGRIGRSLERGDAFGGWNARSDNRPRLVSILLDIRTDFLISWGSGMNEERMSGYPSEEAGQIVMPFYLMCDVSLSMTPDMQRLNDGLQRLRRAILAEPLANDVAYIAIATFSDIAKVVMPLERMSEQQVPTLSAQSGTNYGSAFRLLAQTIAQDTADLKARGLRVYRPCVFFLTDGEPLDRDWHQTFVSTLTYDGGTKVGMKGHPIFVPFGFRQAPEDVLKQLAYPQGKGKWYHAKSASVEQALNGMLGIIMQTVVTSSRTASSAQPAVVPLPPPPNSGIAYGDPDDFV